jgi:hypothetical protein
MVGPRAGHDGAKLRIEDVNALRLIIIVRRQFLVDIIG